MGSPSPGEHSRTPAEALQKLQAVTDAALAHLSLDELLDELLIRIRDALDADTCAFLMLDPDGDELVARAAKGIEEEVEQGVRIPVGKGFAGRIAATRQPVVIEDVDHSFVLNPILREKGIKSLLGVPLLIDGRVLGVLHVGTLTPRDFTQADIELLQVVAYRAAQAIDRALAHAELVRMTEVQREFIALAAHELRTPATTVYGLAATLRERRRALDRDTIEQLDQTLYEQSDRLRRLVEQLLDLSRLDSRTITIARVPVSVRPHLEEIAESFAPDADVDIDVPEDFEATIDPTALERIVGNLIVNAVRYGMPPIKVSAEQRDRHIRITVEDRGKGIAAEFLPQLFERFKRSDTTRETAVGTGLGLAIARSYARAHGGEVCYEPAKPHGARFEVVLPANG